VLSGWKTVAEPVLTLLVKTYDPTAWGAVTAVPPPAYARANDLFLPQSAFTKTVQGPVPVTAPEAGRVAEAHVDEAMLTNPPVGALAAWGAVQAAGTSRETVPVIRDGVT